jgi:hypothetical protein
MPFEPLGHGSRLSIQQQVDGTMALQVDQDRAIAQAFLERPVVNSNGTRFWILKPRGLAQHPQQCIAADLDAEMMSNPPPASARHFETHQAKDAAQTLCASCIKGDEIRQTFDKGLMRASWVTTVKTVNPEFQVHPLLNAV